MTWFAALFGLLNLLIAYGIIRLCANATERADERTGTVGPPVTDRPQIADLPAAPSPPVEASSPDRNQTGTRSVSRPVEEASAAETPAQAPPSASHAQQLLQTLGQQIRFARMVGQKEVAEDVTTQLRDWSVWWQRQLNEYLARTPEAADADGVEMCLAQIESTLSNLDALLWDEGVDVVLDRVERECTTVEKSVRDFGLCEPVECQGTLPH